MPIPIYNPKYKELPTYTAPEWNEKEITALTQKRAAPGLRGLRQQIQQVSGMSADNPNMKRMTLRDALAGFGSGVSNVIGSAGSAAAGEYGQKFGAESGNALNMYKSRADAIAAENQQIADIAGKNWQSGMTKWEAEQAAARQAAQNFWQTSEREGSQRYQTESQKRQQDYEKMMDELNYGQDISKMGIANDYQIAGQARQEAYNKMMAELGYQQDVNKMGIQQGYQTDNQAKQNAYNKMMAEMGYQQDINKMGIANDYQTANLAKQKQYEKDMAQWMASRDEESKKADFDRSWDDYLKKYNLQKQDYERSLSDAEKAELRRYELSQKGAEEDMLRRRREQAYQQWLKTSGGY